jgi:hypothetical protein
MGGQFGLEPPALSNTLQHPRRWLTGRRPMRDHGYARQRNYPHAQRVSEPGAGHTFSTLEGMIRPDEYIDVVHPALVYKLSLVSPKPLALLQYGDNIDFVPEERSGTAIGE